MKHYLQVRDEDFAKAVQNPVQPSAGVTGQSRTDQAHTCEETAKNAVSLAGVNCCKSLQNQGLAPRGFEPLLPG
jgi:hypothetical protein